MKRSLDDAQPITTLVFDIDDTLYDVGTGFTAHRNGPSVSRLMVEKLGFKTEEAAMALRNEYFEKYHSTVKALKMAEKDGRLPAPFEAPMLAEWWTDTLDFKAFLSPDASLIEDLAASPLRLVAFTNGPRRYALKVLDALGVRAFFPDDQVFAVEDMMPHCKPEAEAFRKVLEAVGASPEECVMLEDSMKNIRAAKKLGMRTVLVSGSGSGDAASSEATKPGDAPVASDTAVDVVIATIGELRTTLPRLWESPSVFG